MRKVLLSILILTVTSPALARQMTPAEVSKSKHDIKVMLDEAKRGCILRYGLYHKDEVDHCVVGIANQWFRDWSALHPEID